METSPEEYRDQVENWKETVCEMTFGEKASEQAPEPDK